MIWSYCMTKPWHANTFRTTGPYWVKFTSERHSSPTLDQWYLYLCCFSFCCLYDKVLNKLWSCRRLYMSWRSWKIIVMGVMTSQGKDVWVNIVLHGELAKRSQLDFCQNWTISFQWIALKTIICGFTAIILNKLKRDIRHWNSYLFSPWQYSAVTILLLAVTIGFTSIKIGICVTHNKFMTH